jgi:hypothetical protein
MQCNITFKGVHKTILIHDKVAIPHSFNILLTYNQKDLT